MNPEHLLGNHRLNVVITWCVSHRGTCGHDPLYTRNPLLPVPTMEEVLHRHGSRKRRSPSPTLIGHTVRSPRIGDHPPSYNPSNQLRIRLRCSISPVFTSDKSDVLKQKACGTPSTTFTRPPSSPPRQDCTRGPSSPTHPSIFPPDHIPYNPSVWPLIWVLIHWKSGD